jgi:hypothetical protein
MKKLIMLSLVATMVVFAQNAEQLKKDALLDCSTKVELLPIELREAVMSSCTCEVNNTDYEAVIADTEAGNTDKIQADADAVIKKCEAEKLSK